MPEAEVEVSRSLAFSPVIVWDALVDEVLVEGWLTTASIDAHVGGRYRLDWGSGANRSITDGTILELVARERLVLEIDNIGRLELVLTPAGIGNQSTGTLLELRLRVDQNVRSLLSTRTFWTRSLDQLDELLRGRPIDPQE